MNWKATLAGLLLMAVFGWAVVTYAQIKLVDGNETAVGTTTNPLITQLGDGTDTANVDSSGNLLVSLGTLLSATTGDHVGIGPVVPGAGTLSYALVDTATSGDQTIISGTGGQTIKIHSIEYWMNADNNIIVKCASTTKVPVQNFLANTGVMRGTQADPYWSCADGEAFILNLSASQQVSGGVWYVQD
jgi:hypothetical protein